MTTNQVLEYNKANPIRVKFIPQYNGWLILEYIPRVTSLFNSGFPYPAFQFSPSVILAYHHMNNPTILIIKPSILKKACSI